MPPDAVCAELVERGLTAATAEALIADVTAPGSDPVRRQLDTTERGRLGLTSGPRASWPSS
jgi:histidyl-tRNA synthetase